MNRITHPQQIQNATVKILYKKEQATGFFVTKNIILTAMHTFLDSKIDENAIQVNSGTDSLVKCRILLADSENDICLLLSETDNPDFLPLNSTEIRVGENWESYGFPYQGEHEGLRIFGTINQTVEKQKYDFTLNCREIDGNYSYDGLSGSCIVCENKVIGIILKQLGDKIGALSIGRITALLQNEDISVQLQQPVNEIPKQLVEDIRSTISNYDVINRLDLCISQNGSWILLEGNPGTGKTSNVATYTPQQANIVLGKYFTKVPNDDKPKSLRTSKEFFLKWLEETVSLSLTGSIAPKSFESINTRVEALSLNFEELGSYLKSQDKTGILFIDGIDEVTAIDEFLDILPTNLPKNIKIVLSCTSEAVLPSEIKQKIPTAQKISVSPLDQKLCEIFIQKRLDKKIDFDNIQKIAEKSEGHPLYLNYLIEYIKSNEISDDSDEMKRWIDNIPFISGNIINYYDAIWDKIYENKSKLWICLILSQLRQGIEKDDFLKILPADIKSDFYSVFPKISHLAKSSQQLEIYHNSFKEYILNKVSLFKTDCNDLIVKFCETETENKYSLTNSLYHYSLSSYPAKAIAGCGQMWADKMAANHIEPDLIVDDIKSVIALAIDMENTAEVLRLILLLQRIDFRYNSVFVEYAFEITLALIASKKYSQAIKYIVRRNTLLVSIKDAVHFLQHFYENDAVEEILILQNAIDKEYRKLIDSGEESGEIPIYIFIVKAQTIILSSNADFETSEEHLRDYLMMISRLFPPMPPKQDESSVDYSSMEYFFNYCFAWRNAYLFRMFNWRLDLTELFSDPQNKIDKNWSSLFATSILIYRNELNNFNLSGYYSSEDEKLLVGDLEFLIENIGYKNEKSLVKKIVLALLPNANRTDLLVPILEEYQTHYIIQEIRSSNGVDFNFSAYSENCIVYNCRGFLNKDQPIASKPKKWNYKNWHKDLDILIEEIHLFEGKLYYYKVAGELDKKSKLLWLELKNMIDGINFSFDARSRWERAYQIPEQVFPHLYTKFITLLHEFNSEEIAAFLKLIFDKCENQLGLYSEGYRRTLHEIIKTLIQLEYDVEQILKLTDYWQIHIISGVQNRWERTAELLKINEVFNVIFDDQKAEINFQQMLDTSMGPSWYKESQLSIINSTLKRLQSNPDCTVLQNFAAILDYASGEMTFQRYVRHNKEEFISSLIVNEKFNEALEYYKFEVLPPPKVIIRNAEISRFDAPRVGDGYCLGARNLTEQSGILSILENATLNPYLKWALSEIFTINDDIFRYVDGYGKQIAVTLNEIEKFNDGHIDSVCESISDLITSQHIDIEDRRSLLNALAGKLSSANLKRIRDLLFIHNINWGSNEQTEPLEAPHLEKKKDSFDQFNDAVSKDGAKNKAVLLKQGLTAFEKEIKSIWYPNWSNSSDKARYNIKQLLESRSALKDLKKNIMEFDNEYWVIYKELIWFLEDKLESTQIPLIYENLSAHFHYIIRHDIETKEKYSWVTENLNANSNDIAAVDFIIWHLNHPDKYYRTKTADTLVKLSQYYPAVINRLFASCLGNTPEHASEQCSYILLKVSIQHPELIIAQLEKNPELIEIMAKCEHFTIKKNLVNISINLNKNNYNNLYLEIHKTIPKSIVVTGEVFIDEENLEMIEYEIEDLNENLLLDEKFCKKLVGLIDEYCYPLSKEEILKSDKYLRRSFYIDDNFIGRYEQLLRHALNNSISHRMAENTIELINEIIN